MIRCFLVSDAEINKKTHLQQVCLMWEEKQPPETWTSCYYHKQHLLPQTTHSRRGFEECLSDVTPRSESSTRLEEQQQPLAFQHARNKELLVWWTKKMQHPIVSQWSDYEHQMSSIVTHTLQQDLLWKSFSLWSFWVTKQTRYEIKDERHT